LQVIIRKSPPVTAWKATSLQSGTPPLPAAVAMYQILTIGGGYGCGDTSPAVL
jgi:hypothetical protein